MGKKQEEIFLNAILEAKRSFSGQAVRAVDYRKSFLAFGWHCFERLLSLLYVGIKLFLIEAFSLKFVLELLSLMWSIFLGWYDWLYQ